MQFISATLLETSLKVPTTNAETEVTQRNTEPALMPQDPQVKNLLGMLRAQAAMGLPVNCCISAVRSQLENLGLVDPVTFDKLERAADILRIEAAPKELSAAHTNSETKYPRWYAGPDEHARKWPALEQYLRVRKKYDETTIASLDKLSSEIVSMLGNPASNERTQRRGLVIGYVQSGKTANMTAVIAKAVDAGYNMVVVLAGLTNKLRQQTQVRIEQDLVDFPEMHKTWVLHTTRQPDGDFEHPRGVNGGFVDFDSANLLVIKKTTRRTGERHPDGSPRFSGPMGKFEEALSNTTEAVMKKLRVLVIDDECDQGSVNSAAQDKDVSTINECIRQTLQRLHFVTYVGYTATPFANVLINPYPNDKATVDGGQIDDLYPSSFITALPKPDAYFGAERIFGNITGDSQDELTYGLPYLKDIPPKDEKRLQPEKASERDEFTPSMTDSLEEAILYFLACCSARIARGDKGEHMTMLIHTSMYKRLHESVAQLVENWIVQQQKSLTDPSSDISGRLIRIYHDEQEKMEGHFPGLRKISPEELLEHLPSVLHDLEFLVENGDAEEDDKLNYSGTPKRYIVTGGTILSRGLTLEGLVVSYFLRSTSQIDTLLQMGRWFGYRTNHEDLPRIWITPELQEAYAHLTEVESHIRNDIARYRQLGMTPLDLAVRIPVVPGMAITGAAKRRHAGTARLSYDGQHEQTTRFHHHDRKIVNGNWEAGASLLTEADQMECRSSREDRYLWTQVPLSAIDRFFESYHPHETQKNLAPELIRDYLRTCGQQDKLTQWNVAIVSKKSSDTGLSAMLGPVEVNLNQRSQMRSSLPGSAWLKSLSSSRECLFDIPEEQLPSPLPTTTLKLREFRKTHADGIPLLLLYPLDANAPAKGGDDDRDRKSLDAIDNLLGYAIQFPELNGKERNLIAVDIQAPFVDHDTRADDEEK